MLLLINEISDCSDRYRDQLQIVTVSGYIVCCRFVSAFQDTSIVHVPHNHTPMFDLVSCSLLYIMSLCNSLTFFIYYIIYIALPVVKNMCIIQHRVEAKRMIVHVI